jgi:membrane-associated protease RseP (regulator of RpoE activity)
LVADTTDAVGQVRAHLDAARSADGFLGASAEIAQAFVAAKAGFEAGSELVSIVGDAASGANTELRAAFDAAPACQGS